MKWKLGATVTLLALGACRGPADVADSQPTSEEQPSAHPAVWGLSEPVADSATELPLTVLGGGCHADTEELALPDVEESSDRIVISTFVEEPPTGPEQDCPSVGRKHLVTVQLERALGDRELVDPACDGTPALTACEGSKRDRVRVQ